MVTHEAALAVAVIAGTNAVADKAGALMSAGMVMTNVVVMQQASTMTAWERPQYRLLSIALRTRG